MSDDLVAFLQARLDEDEARARRVQAALDAGWNYFDETPTELIDPARVLREVETKRSILNRWVKSAEDPRDIRLVAHAELEGNLALLWAVRQLAAVYSDHPGYREEWRP